MATAAKEVLDGFNHKSRALFTWLLAPWTLRCDLWLSDHYGGDKPKPAVFVWFIKNQANMVSTARLPIGVWIALYWIRPAYPEHGASLYWALFVMVLVFLSDGFDGALARDIVWRDPVAYELHDCTSKYGKAVDPMADKATAAALVFALAAGASPLVPADLMTVWYIELVPVGIFELCLIGIALWTNHVCVRSGTQEPAGANLWGKAKFFLQAVALLFGLIIASPTAGVGTAMILLGIALPLAYLSLRGHAFDLKMIQAKIKHT